MGIYPSVILLAVLDINMRTENVFSLQPIDFFDAADFSIF
ncbi:hypothetical protein SDC9_190813 [bioreactor metagenome]|uniref:Uncharacterized protein n=1 Tax=bioreactor metagenome TaxID=1076179 RepID=A0A645I4A7_9ZZZZ